MILALFVSLIAIAQIHIPAEYIGVDGLICIKKIDPQSCNSCDLSYYLKGRKLFWSMACTELGCPPVKDSGKCLIKLAKKKFVFPKLHSFPMENCIEAVFRDQRCNLELDPKKGLRWKCFNDHQKRSSGRPKCIQDIESGE